MWEQCCDEPFFMLLRNHSLCCSGTNSKMTWSIRDLNFWSKFHTDSVGSCLMSLSSVIHCDSDLGFLNSLIIAVLTYTSVLAGAVVYFIYHVKALSLSVVTNWTSLILSSWIPLMVHMASHKNQCCSRSSSPIPLKVGNFMSSPILFLRGGFWFALLLPLGGVNVSDVEVVCTVCELLDGVPVGLFWVLVYFCGV